MKHLQKFTTFLLLEEAELKYSTSAFDQINKLLIDFKKKHSEWKKEHDEWETNWNAGRKDWGPSAEPSLRYHPLKISLSEILYPKFAIQLGAVILQKRSELDSDKGVVEFISNVEKSITQKKLNDFLTDYLNKTFVSLRISFFSPNNETIGSFSPAPELLQGSICNYELRLSFAAEENNIKHELQHLTQTVNGLCLKTGEKIIKGEIDLNFKTFFKKINDLPILNLNAAFLQGNNTDIKNIRKEIKNIKFGGGKTKTKLNQNDKISNYDDQTGKKTHLKRILNLDINTEEGRKKAEELQYLLDDDEYKPWITDLVDSEIKHWQKENNNPKSFNVNDIAKKLTTLLLNENEVIKILKKYRKETAKDILNLFTIKLKALLN